MANWGDYSHTQEKRQERMRKTPVSSYFITAGIIMPNVLQKDAVR